LLPIYLVDLLFNFSPVIVSFVVDFAAAADAAAAIASRAERDLVFYSADCN